MEQEQNQDKSNLLSTIKEKFKFGLQELKQKSETYKEDILNVIPDLFNNSNQSVSSKRENLNEFLDYLVTYLKLNSRIEEFERQISYSEAKENQSKNVCEGQNMEVQEMDINEEENNNSNGDNNINSKKY